MQKSLIVALLVALASGLAIGSQSSLTNASGRLAGATLTGLLINFLGGLSAGAVLLAITLRQGPGFLSGLRGPTLAIIFIAGLLGIGIITGVAYSLPKVGVAAGLSALIAGQMTVGVLVDSFGLIDGQPIPLNLSRVAGLALLALAVWALLPKK
jgi:transporter family-2 protein